MFAGNAEDLGEGGADAFGALAGGVDRVAFGGELAGDVDDAAGVDDVGGRVQDAALLQAAAKEGI